MLLELVEKLEELISCYALQVQKLKAENFELTNQVQSLTAKLNDQKSYKGEIRLELDEIKILKNTNRKMKTDRERVRKMVHGILDDLDKVQII